MKKLYPFLFILMFILLHIFLAQFTLVVAGDDSACTNSPNHPSSPGLGGTCQWDLRDATTCMVGTTPGTVVRNKCFSNASSDYRCCVPDEEEEKERVYEDYGCEDIGGQCQWTNSIGACSLGDETGCYMYGTCRSEGQNIRDGQLYLCCVSDDNLCGKGVDYSLWNDVYINERGCPFSNPSESDDRLWCSQGPESDPSHNYDYTAPSVDIILSKEGKPGSEYFIAPDGGHITFAKAFYTQGDQKCGCHLEFETDGGITYQIRHCFLFTGISVHYNQREGSSKGEFLGAGDGLRIEKGEVIAKIAIDDDDSVIETRPFPSCSTFPHFHVKVTGNVDRCVDCHFVDKLGCNLYNDGNPETVGARPPLKAGLCGRCYRSEFPNIEKCFGDERVAPWNGVRCNSTVAGCDSCNDDPVQYCCESDRVWCCTGPAINQVCEWVCNCPHPTPPGPGWGGGSSDSSGTSGSSESTKPSWLDMY